MIVVNRASIGLFLAVASLMAGTSACTGSSQQSADATVSGTVRGYGGPAVLIHGKPRMAVDGAPEPNQPITARRTDGLVVNSASGRDGRYGIGLPPGRYVIRAGCSIAVTITVRSGELLTVPLRCDFP